MSTISRPMRHPELFNYVPLTDQQIGQYREQGYVNLGRVLTDAGLQQVRAQIMAAWRAEKGPFDPAANWLKNSLLADIHHYSEAVRKYYFSGPLVDVAARLIGPNIKAVTAQLTFKLRGNTMPFDWHQDNAYGELDPYNALTCLTALDDADERNGCLWLIPGSHKAGQADFQRSEADRCNQRPVVLEVDESRAVAAPMQAGEVLFFHCHMLHHSEGNRSTDRDRRLMLFRYADADAVEVYNAGAPRLGRLLRGTTVFPAVEAFEADLRID